MTNLYNASLAGKPGHQSHHLHVLGILYEYVGRVVDTSPSGRRPAVDATHHDGFTCKQVLFKPQFNLVVLLYIKLLKLIAIVILICEILFEIEKSKSLRT